MKAEKPEIENLARLLCTLYDGDQNKLVPGNMAQHSEFDEFLFVDGAYDRLFDSNPDYSPDGLVRGEPAMFAWRDHVFKAKAVLRHFADQPT